MGIEGKRLQQNFPIGDLKPHPRNPNRGDVAQIKASMDVIGDYSALVVRETSSGDMIILAGNHRWRAAIERGTETVDVCIIRCDDDTADRILLADNRIAEFGVRDNEDLAAFLKGMVDEGVSLDGTGYTTDDLDVLIEDLSPTDLEAVTEDDIPEAPSVHDELLEKWRPKAGQVWAFPESGHRIMCGSCTDLEHLAFLFGEERADLAWSDPPYGIDYKGRGKGELTIINDGHGGLRSLLDGYLAGVVVFVSPGSPVYIAHPAGLQSMDFMQAVADCEGVRYRQTLVWVKSHFALGAQDYHPRYEPIIYGFTEGGEGRKGRFGRTKKAVSERTWFGGDGQSDVLEFPKPTKNDLHPTMKPVELVSYCIQNSSRQGDVVFDSFLGSGTTALASHALGRRCFGTELDPKYLAVILERLSEATGETPVLVHGELAAGEETS